MEAGSEQCTAANSGVASESETPDSNDTSVPAELIPPPPSQRELAGNRIRNMAAVVWGVYLLGIFCLPEKWVYWPSIAVLDVVLGPVIVAVGKAAAVAVISAGLAVLTMMCQRLLTDNQCLLQAKRRDKVLVDEAQKYPRGTPRRKALLDVTANVPKRLAMAGLVSLAVLAGPTVLVFYWLPLRADAPYWLLISFVSYLPVMLLSRFLLRVA